MFTLLEIEDVFVFKMPATSSAAGYRAADMKEQVWDGTLKIMQKGQRAAIQLIGRDGKLFCLAPVTADGPPAYEPVSDSSRYFVLRIANAAGTSARAPAVWTSALHHSHRRHAVLVAGRHAFVGLAFQERAHAFDFKSTLADFEQCVLGPGPAPVCRNLAGFRQVLLSPRLAGNSSSRPAASPASRWKTRKSSPWRKGRPSS